MKLKLFLTLSAIICFLFGLPSLLFPFEATAQFGMTLQPESSLVVRSLGGMILSMGVLYFLVRHENESLLLKKILFYSAVAHILGLAVTLYGMAAVILPADKLIPNLAVHLFMGVGSILYWNRMKNPV
jgi:hypothetical protein